MLDQTARVDAAITTRRSIRAFLPTPVPRETIEDILGRGARAVGHQHPAVEGLRADRRAAKALSRQVCAAYDDPREARHATPRSTPTTRPSGARPTSTGGARSAGTCTACWASPRPTRPACMRSIGATTISSARRSGLMFTIDRVMRQGSWLDYGMFLQNLMVAARGRGLHTCPQAAFTQFHRIISRARRRRRRAALVCGMSLGHADPQRRTLWSPSANQWRRVHSSWSSRARCEHCLCAVGRAVRRHPAVDRAAAAAGAVASGTTTTARSPAAWALAFLLPFAGELGAAAGRGTQLVHALLAEYIPFIILLLGAVHGRRRHPHARQPARHARRSTPRILAIGAVLASLMGTTGASMLLIRPLIRANDNRAHGRMWSCSSSSSSRTSAAR